MDAAPTVSLSATETGPGSYDLNIDVANFTFIDENAPAEPVDGEGHLHLYVDGRVTSMLYSDAGHVEDLAPGEHELRVELSAADHQPWLIDGEPIDATTTVTVEGDAPTGRDHRGHGGGRRRHRWRQATTCRWVTW